MHNHSFYCLLNHALTPFYLSIHLSIYTSKPSCRQMDQSQSQFTITMKGKSVKQYIKKCRSAAIQALQAAIWCSCCSWDVMLSFDEAKAIPEDVPKGHFVVYVGEHCRRYVIEIALLKHPMFKALLDSAEEMFGFVNGPKLYLPCKEYVFDRILQCIGSYTKPHNFSPSLEVEFMSKRDDLMNLLL